MPRATDPHTRVLRLIDKLAPSMQKAFLIAINDVKVSLGTITNIERLILSGQLLEAHSLAVESASGHMIEAQTAMYIVAGKAGAGVISKALKVAVRFDQVNERAVTAIRQNKFELIREFTEEQRLTAQQALIEGTTRGLNPRQQARHFRDSVGLTTRQQQHVSNYHTSLLARHSSALQRKLRDKRFDSTVQRAIDTDEPLTNAQIKRMVGRYREKYIKYRSEVIARTEALRGVHQGTEEAYRQAIESGSLDPTKLKRKWVAKLDGRERDSHHHLNGTIRNFGQVFEGKYGDLRFPGDPKAPGVETIQCRCSLATRIVP